MRYTTCISILFLIFTFGPINGQTQLSKIIYFDFDDDNISTESKSELLQFKNELAYYTESHLRVIGHTDQDGSDDYNMQLSRRRAESVEQFITQNQFPSADIVVNYLGESDLVLLGTDTKAKEKNRRVTVFAEVYDYKNAEEVVSHLIPNNDELKSINQRSESILNLRRGTKVKIPANAFCNVDGSPLEGDNLDIVFKEAFDFAEMIDERLFTQTEDQILETGGMIYIAASQGGKELKLQDGKRIDLIFPKQEFKNGMELFTGVDDKNGVTWNETGEEITSNKDDLFIQIDLSTMFDVTFETIDSLALDLAPMPKYPYPKRIAYPPYRENYTEEKYKEVYQKYENVMAAHYKDEEDRPERLEKWHSEVSRRKKILYNHKKMWVRSELSKELGLALSRIRKKQYTVSNDKLVGSILSFLDTGSGTKARYNEAYYRNKIFDVSLRDVLKHDEIRTPDYKRFSARAYFPTYDTLMVGIQKRIMNEKYRLGYVDGNIFANYIVSSSNLGWINCDRFYNIPDSEKMDLAVADIANNHQYYLIFNNIKSLIRPKIKRNKIVFEDIPKGEDVKIIGLGYKNNAAYIATQNLTLGSGDAIALSYQKKSIKELRELFNEI